MLGCNEVATRGGRGEVTDWVVTGGGHPPLSAASTPPTYILEMFLDAIDMVVKNISIFNF